MSLLNDVQKFIEAHPGCTSGDIADAFAGYSRQRVLQSASKLRQSGRVAHRCEGDTRRHFPRLAYRIWHRAMPLMLLLTRLMAQVAPRCR
ncbi:TPA: hypothetical protein IFZ87_004286 [Escherichia coli]|nr:hypothetical protein [Escherichia coli]